METLLQPHHVESSRRHESSRKRLVTTLVKPYNFVLFLFNICSLAVARFDCRLLCKLYGFILNLCLVSSQKHVLTTNLFRNVINSWGIKPAFPTS